MKTKAIITFCVLALALGNSMANAQTIEKRTIKLETKNTAI